VSLPISWPDLKLSARLLRKYPGLTFVASVGIAVGIGISAGAFAFFCDGRTDFECISAAAIARARRLNSAEWFDGPALPHRGRGRFVAPCRRHSSELIVDRQEQLIVRLTAMAMSLVMVTGFLLSAASVYALVSFGVAQRRREIGIRTALGASGYQVLRSVFSRVAVQVSVGLIVGIAGAVALEFAATGVVLTRLSAIVIPAIAVIMTIVGFFAAFGPARRGLSIQPTEALKAE
jgi:FtsX-like permease family